MKKVLITGAGGFIGSHLAERCADLGYETKAMIRYNSANRWGWLEGSSYFKQIEVVSGDIRDFDSVVGAMKGCRTVFHLAALIGIPYSYLSPLAYIKTNIEGTYNVLQAGRELGVESVVVTSTSETYGTAQYVPINEAHPLVGQSPYSATKIGADHLAMSYYRSFGLPVRIVRPFNVYGPRQSTRAVIPTIISQMLGDPPKLSLGNLSPTRDYTYVEDTVEGFVEIERSPDTVGDVLNVGTGMEISIGALVEKIALMMGVQPDTRTDPVRQRPDASEVERLVCDNTKIRTRTGWRPKWDLDRGLVQTIEWIRSHARDLKPSVYGI